MSHRVKKMPKPRPHEKPSKNDEETEVPIDYAKDKKDKKTKDDKKTKLVKAKVLKPMPEKSYKTVG